ncbi:Small subunit (SSU) processome component [Komagataella phaffii CBS 7435]|uniref:Nucleolar protein, component of the small subunit (SSU) processome containing the U3 snoRNA n=2 Tax=Komagataella phaffii TaxID=460519 RepID=C4QWE2_KOMPG|nr:Nucleolar protein, component of the small subunit (SSU) processome containing the U3 snoRNA [Komagataella phaffii GS115]AOA61395.1 GQ67_02778T0 [Komagataella phaffii]CAH2446235.1 Small subunit (SSU) processome component [Komagataella phaffii CBS 7435]AOA66744.1 GQ68_02470T0 [Komagataella phaffii GS115]CAY67565.1 Nucleolar protein, component of the small subunit (SSU) processome containing the U3 snoRNA [Komagataella phaffii GS115]CCA36661.1 Small subunit (SSU) processome component [Komagata
MDIHRCRFVKYKPRTVTSLAFSHFSSNGFAPKNLRLAVGKSNGNIEIWNPHKNFLLENVLQGGKDRVIEGLVWSTYDDYPPRLFSIGGSTVMTEWDIATGLPLNNYDCNSGITWSISINTTQDKICVGCDNGTVVVIDISGGPGSLVHESILQRSNARVLNLCWLNDKKIVSGCSDGRIRIWNYEEGPGRGQLISTLNVDKSTTESTLVWSVIPLEKRSQFVSGDSTGAVKVWDAEKFVLLQTFDLHKADVLNICTNFEQTKIFSGSVDRKIYNLKFVNDKWVNSCNRLVHGNDIRASVCYQSKDLDLLLSGASLSDIAVSKPESFQDCEIQRLSVFPETYQTVLFNKSQKLVIMWQDQTIKVWKVLPQQGRKLLAKLVLSDEDNITHCDLTSDGQFLVVARLSTVKVFKLAFNEDNKLQIQKVADEKLQEVGARLVKFNDQNNELIVVSPDNELYIYKIKESLVEDSNGFVDQSGDSVQEVELNGTRIPQGQQTLLNNIYSLCLSKDGKLASVLRVNGLIEIANLDTLKSSKLVKPSNLIALHSVFHEDHKLIVVNHDNSVAEYTIDTEEGVVSDWSKRNTDFTRHALGGVLEKCLGLVLNGDNLWLYNTNWLAYINLANDLPKIGSEVDRKRGADGEKITPSSKDIQVDNSQFWVVDKYQPLLYVDTFEPEANGLLVVETPVTPTEAAFLVPRIYL